jgi:putative endonuclease
MRTYCVYILSSKTRVLYVGVTANLEYRLAQHRAGAGARFTARYGVYRLVHVETTASPLVAIAREKEIKAWRRSKKIALIETQNPRWQELAPQPVIKKERSD